MYLISDLITTKSMHVDYISGMKWWLKKYHK